MIRLCAFADEAADGLTGQIEALQRNGIALTELRSVDGKNVSQFSENEARDIGRRLKRDGISVWSVGSPLGKVDIGILEKDWEESVKRICGIANALDADKIRAFSFFNAYGQDERVFEKLNIAADIAKKFNITLFHENEKGIFGDVYERVLLLMQNLKDWKFIYDPANFIQVGSSTEHTLSLATRCGYFHMKDVIAVTGEVVPVGEGDGAVDKLLDKIDADTVLSIEPHLAVFSAYAQIDDSEMKLKYRFESNKDAFDTAVAALKILLAKCGYKKTTGGYGKVLA